MDRAIAHGEIGVAYRPVLDLGTEKIAGFEALPYSRASELPTAKALFRAAHAAGRAGDLGALYRERALAGAPRERLFLPTHVAELDALFFAPDDDPLFHHGAEVVLQLAPRDPHGALELSQELAAVLRARGIGLCFSEFGGGRSSVGDVIDFSPTIVKVDRELLASTGTARGRMHFAAIVAWAREMGIDVAARVETETQLELARATGVRYADGPILGPPSERLASSSESG